MTKLRKKVFIIGGTGLVGRAIKESLAQTYEVVVSAGHHEVEGGYQLQAEDTDRLLEILEQENPQIVISSINGAFVPQYTFHTVLADWMSKEPSKRLLFISTANVFDGDLSQPCTEQTPPNPESDYGKFKRDCETMLMEKLPAQLCGRPAVQEYRSFGSTAPVESHWRPIQMTMSMLRWQPRLERMQSMCCNRI